MEWKIGRREFLGGVAGALGASAPLWGSDEQVIPFLDTKPFNPEKPNLPWDQLTSWITPDEHIFSVGHYGVPEFDLAGWKLELGGLIDKPRSFTLEELKARPAKEHTATLECSGNGPAGGLIANARWKGTPLAPILKEAGVKPGAIEAVFYAADHGVEKIRGADYPQHFARSLSVPDAAKANVLLGYEMNGKQLEKKHGAPVRLIVPGWYGVAWVKWLNRIELHDRRFLSRFMGRDYVTIRGEKRGEDVIWRETSVGRMNLKSVPARVTRGAGGALQVTGAAWSDGTPIQSVEVRVDDEAWRPAKLTANRDHPFCWTFWSFDWSDAKPGEHTIASRARDARGRVQPAPDDPFITMKKTYWEANQQAFRKIRV
ncbi:MAG TPA: sulfite oxidase [Bryobacteraceae bacterium]|nr:sulfite oxidase [Bryobacteraceae bacterium]